MLFPEELEEYFDEPAQKVMCFREAEEVLLGRIVYFPHYEWHTVTKM